MDAIVLAGGYGTRLASAVGGLPKVLAPVLNRPFVEHLILHLKQQGIVRIVFCVGFKAEIVQKALGDGAHLNVSILYSHDGKCGSDDVRGTAHAVRKALTLVEGKSFWVVNGDTFVPGCWRLLYNHFTALNGIPTLALYKNNNQFWRSNVILSNGKVVKYEKTTTLLEAQHVDAGVAIYPREVFDEFEHVAQLPDLMSLLSRSGHLAGAELSSRFYEINTSEGLSEMERYLTARPSKT